MKGRPAVVKPDEVPYCAKNVDAAIAHLERVLSVADAQEIFGQRYWLERVQQLLAAPDLLPLHRNRLRHLLDSLASPSAQAPTPPAKRARLTESSA
jgi:hypothetical protein